MDEQDCQNLDIAQRFSDAAVKGMISSGERIDTPRIEYSDSQLPNVLVCNYFHPLCNQVAHYGVLLRPQWEPMDLQLAIRPTVPSSGQAPDADALGPGMSDGNLGVGDEFRAFADVQMFANGSRPGRRTADHDGGPLRVANPPFNHWNGNGAHPPNLFRAASHGQSVHMSPQQLEYMAGTHPRSSFEHDPGQKVEASELSGFQLTPEIEIAQGSKNSVKDAKRWPCPRAHRGCKKSYRRPQEVRRHMRDKHHEITPKCFLCDFKWTRAEKIRGHLISEHRGCFTEEERQKLRHCRGLGDTIDYLEILEITRL